jgi:hypothetical protein
MVFCVDGGIEIMMPVTIRPWEGEEKSNEKRIVIKFIDCRLMTDVTCKDWRKDEVCDKCRLRLNCFINEDLIINYRDLQLEIETPVNEKVKRWLDAHKIQDEKVE